jgi:hypothetical protein
MLKTRLKAQGSRLKAQGSSKTFDNVLEDFA